MLSQINAKFGNSKFSIFISDNSISSIEIYLKNFNKKNIVIFADNIFFKKKYHPDKKFTNILNKYKTYFIKSGIKNKNFSSLIDICMKMSKSNLTKDGIVIAVGGGVVGDIVSLAASLYKRGIKLVHLPTTMTSFVDSCIGGKTGINFDNQVNLVGSYYQPEVIFIDTRFLNTLNFRDLKSGLVESIKKSFLTGGDFFNFLYDNSRKILNLEYDILSELIIRSINSKIYFASNDVKEHSLRLFLNYGHTFGQAIESHYGINQNYITHGEAVSLGMMCAARMQCKISKNKKIIDLHEEILKKYDLPTKYYDVIKLKKPNILKLSKFLKNDKKRTIENVRFILCKDVGKPYILQGSSAKNIRDAFAQIF